MTLCAANEADAIKIVESALKIEGPCTSERLSGGLSGSALFKVYASDRSCVVRFWNAQWSEYFPQDLICQVIASDSGYGPKVYFSDISELISVMEYLPSDNFPETKLRLQLLVDLIKSIHTGPAVPQGIDRETELRELIESVEKLNPQFLNMQLFRDVTETVFAATRSNAHCVACHRDLHPGNLIFTKGRFVAIDYTWGGMDDPFVDLATIAIFNCTTDEEEKLLLELYLGHAPSKIEFARLALMKVITKTFYGLEVLKLGPTCALSSTTTPKVQTKCYMNFGCHNAQPMSPDTYLEYAVSILGEVVEYSQSEQFAKHLNDVISINQQ